MAASSALQPVAGGLVHVGTAFQQYARGIDAAGTRRIDQRGQTAAIGFTRRGTPTTGFRRRRITARIRLRALRTLLGELSAHTGARVAASTGHRDKALGPVS